MEKWGRRPEGPPILLALAFLVAYAWPVLDPRLDPTTRNVLEALSWTVWVAFALDLLIRLVLADNRRAYALHHWYDVALVALPLLRPLRLLRLVGYGDRYPVTSGGRIVGVVLMVAGIGVLGAVIASVTSWILGRVAAERIHPTLIGITPARAGSTQTGP